MTGKIDVFEGKKIGVCRDLVCIWERVGNLTD